MKKYLCIMLSVAFLFITCMAGCGSKEDYSAEESGIVVTIKGESISKTGIMCEFYNTTDNFTFEHGDGGGLDRYVDGQWEDVPQIVEFLTTHCEAYIVRPGATTEYEFSWEYIYGKLPKGEYRFVMHFDKYAMANLVWEDGTEYYGMTDEAVDSFYVYVPFTI